MKNTLSAIVFLIFLIIACGIIILSLSSNIANVFQTDDGDYVEISILYAPESDLYLKDAIESFNNSYKSGIHPVTKARLGSDDVRFKVVGQSASSGTVKDQIVSAVLGVNTDKVSRPTIYAPSVGHWLNLVNFETGRDIFLPEDTVPTAEAPVVIAIWESRLNWLKQKYPNEEIGWRHLLSVFNSPNGWLDFAPAGTKVRPTVYYGHTDPRVSSTALSTLIAEYFSAAKYIAGNADLEKLTLNEVNNEAVKKGVRDIESLIKHYSSRTTEFKEYIAQGPNYLDFVALEENDLIYINQGKTEYKPPEKLVALYPSEGTFIHEHPFAIPNATWVSEVQKTGAKIFTDYILTDEIQQKVLETGFRPVNKNITLAYPIVPELGVDPSKPSKRLSIPTSEVISAVQNSWNFVKKRSELYILLDNSGSMDGEKIIQAKKALEFFAKKLPPDTQFGFYIFNSEVQKILDMESIESQGSKLIKALSEVTAKGGTALYDALYDTVASLQSIEEKSDNIRAVVLLSDGQDTSSQNKNLNDVVQLITNSELSSSPILVIPIAYGSDADISSLNTIARASATRVQTGDTKDIDKLLEIIASYF